jgi:multicomponent Na+:H+ antiporter subunit G
MMLAARVIMDIFILIGCFFAFAGTIGIIRMPDSFCRMQSSTNIATFGTLGVIIGTAVWAFANGNTAMGVKILVIGVFIILTNPIGGHAICRAAYRHGVRPEKKMVCDEYGRDNINE